MSRNGNLESQSFTPFSNNEGIKDNEQDPDVDF